MKNIVYISLVFAIFAASCSSTQSHQFTKRKYTSGHYFAKKGQPSKVKGKEQKQETLALQQKSSQAKIVVENILPSQKANKETVTASAAQVPVVVSATKDVQLKNTVQTVSLEKVSKPSLAQTIKAQRSFNKISHSAAGADDNTILLVILSLFPILALVAMYLHDGKSITMNFWVDLILHFTIIGYLIFALLVVLDIINLA